MSFRRSTIAATLFVLMLLPSAAFGHGETVTTDPENGATLKRAPKIVSVTLTEAPAEGAEFIVKDGCGKTVSRAAKVDGDVLITSVSGEPGRWSARYRVVSAVDGHLTKDKLAFTVEGKKDCSKDKPKPSGNDKDGTNGNGDKNAGDQGSGNAAGDQDDDGSSFPVVPVAAGTGLLVGLALLIRSRSAG